MWGRQTLSCQLIIKCQQEFTLWTLQASTVDGTEHDNMAVLVMQAHNIAAECRAAATLQMSTADLEALACKFHCTCYFVELASVRRMSV